MIKLERYFFAFLLAAAPRLLLAQAPALPGADRRPFYIELRGAYSQCEIRYRASNGIVDVDPLPLAVGYYLTPRLVVQLSGAYGNTLEEKQGGAMQVPAGIYSETIRNNSRHGAVPILLRYAMLPRRNRLQADALLGLMWAYDSYDNYSNSTFNGTILKEQIRSDHGSQFIATVGIGLRFVLNRHFELLYDHAWNRNLDGAPPGLRQELTGNVWGITANRSLALRYRFNWGKQPVVPAP